MQKKEIDPTALWMEAYGKGVESGFNSKITDLRLQMICIDLKILFIPGYGEFR